MSCARSGNRRCDLRRLDAVKLRVILFEIGVALIRDFLLMILGRVGIATVEIFNHVHARSYLPEWSKALLKMIKPGVVGEIYKNLRRARIRTSCLSERNRALSVSLRDRIVLDVGVLPSFINSRASSQSELDHETGNDAKKFDAIEVFVLDEIVETVGLSLIHI